MDDKDSVCFQVGDFEVTLEIYEGEAVGATAVGPEGDPYSVDFAFQDMKREIPGCKICRVVHGHYLCEDIECGVLVAKVDKDEC